MDWRAFINRIYGLSGLAVGAKVPTKPSQVVSAGRHKPDVTPPLQSSPGGDETYREFVKRIAEGELPSPVISNWDPGHATIVVERLFITAKQSVLLLTKQLDNSVYGTPEVLAAAEKFFQRGGSLTILTECPLSPVDNRLLSLALRFHGQLSVVDVPISVQRTYDCHFMLVDGSSYRLEMVKDSWKANVQFDDPRSAMAPSSGMPDTLSKLFARILVQSLANNTRT